MRSITSYQSKLTTAIAQVYGRNLQHATDEQLGSLISRCESIATYSTAKSWGINSSQIELSRQKDGATISASVGDVQKLDALKALAILANIAADREVEKQQAKAVRNSLEEIINEPHAD